MQLYNPNQEDLNHDAMSRNYIIEAGKTRTVTEDVGEHLVRKLKSYGLVSLDYGDKEEKKYGSFDAYKKAKGLEGLKLKLQFLNEYRAQESYGIKESIEKNAAPEIAMNFKVKEFENQIKELRDYISEMEHGEVLEVSEPKKRGRPARKPELIEGIEA